MDGREKENAVIVAHPDDETLWSGGTLLIERCRRLKVATLCRGSDPDRAPRFYRAAETYGAVGMMADLDDGPDQRPLEPQAVQQAVVALIGGTAYDTVYTHSPYGEYTRHRRHEEAGLAILALWEQRALRIRRLRVFAYEDGGKRYLPRAIGRAHEKIVLPEEVWNQKYDIVTKVYGFGQDTYEALTTPRTEAFWAFDSPEAMREWMSMNGVNQ